MATQTHKTLGRANPAAATPATLYTAPPATTTIVTSFFMCNTSGAADDSVRIWIVPSGGSAGDTNVVYKDMPVEYGSTFLANAVPTLLTGDFIVVQSANGTVTFSAFGLEIA